MLVRRGNPPVTGDTRGIRMAPSDIQTTDHLISSKIGDRVLLRPATAHRHVQPERRIDWRVDESAELNPMEVLGPTHPARTVRKCPTFIEDAMDRVLVQESEHLFPMLAVWRVASDHCWVTPSQDPPGTRILA